MLFSHWRLLLNVLLFQLGWFACLSLDLLWAGVCVALILLLHFRFIVSPAMRYLELGVITNVLAVGCGVELIYLQLEVLIPRSGLMLPPLWLLSLWVLFGTTLLHSLSWLSHKPYLAAAFAALAAPLSYYAGTKLNAQMSFNESAVYSLLWVSVSWAIVFPLLMHFFVAKRSGSQPIKRAH